MHHVITVAAKQAGWMMQSGDNASLLFETSAEAIWSARKICDALAEKGMSGEVIVLGGDGNQIGRYLYLSVVQPA